MRRIFHRADERIGVLSEQTARRLNRRQAMLNMVKGASAMAAAASTGSLLTPSQAAADNDVGQCRCDLPGCGNCSCRGKACPANGCPTGCTKCRRGECNPCIYRDANWIACHGCGTSGAGYKKCWDCKCPGCGATCGCKSVCLCSNCSMEQSLLEAAAVMTANV
jgi:hypothetical protein